jgi:hypothetical protein
MFMYHFTTEALYGQPASADKGKQEQAARSRLHRDVVNYRLGFTARAAGFQAAVARFSRLGWRRSWGEDEFGARDDEHDGQETFDDGMR